MRQRWGNPVPTCLVRTIAVGGGEVHRSLHPIQGLVWMPTLDVSKGEGFQIMVAHEKLRQVKERPQVHPPEIERRAGAWVAPSCSAPPRTKAWWSLVMTP